MNVDTGQFTALTERVEQMDLQIAALTRSLAAAYQAAGRPEIGAEVDSLMRARRRARLRLIEGSMR